MNKWKNKTKEHIILLYRFGDIALLLIMSMIFLVLYIVKKNFPPPTLVFALCPSISSPFDAGSHAASLEHFDQLFALRVDEVCGLFSTFVLCLGAGSYRQQISEWSMEGWVVKERLSDITKTWCGLLLRQLIFCFPPHWFTVLTPRSWNICER